MTRHSKVQSSTIDGGWPAAVAFEIGGGSHLMPAVPGRPSHVLYMPCSGPCGTTKEFHFSGKRLPPEAVASKLRRQGWHTGRRLICPSCNGHAPKVAQIKGEEKMVKPAFSGATAMSTAVTPTPQTPSESARAVRRQVIEWLDMAYDLEKQHYKEGFSDESVANETKAAIELVSKMRDDMYGPAQPPEPKEIRRFREELKTLEDAIVAARTSLSALEGRSIAMQNKLTELASKNNWRS